MKQTQLTRHQVDSMTVKVLRRGQRMRPDVRIIQLDGQPGILKDYSVGGTAFKRLLGTYLVQRERNALRRVANIEGIPRVLGQLSADSLVTEYIDAPAAPDADPGLLTPAFFERLRELIDRMHHAGLVHGDLKKPENILVTDDAMPAIVDFTSAVATGSNPMAAMAFPLLWEDDIKAVYKLKKRCAPHLLTEHEDRQLSQRTWIERSFRWSRRYVRYALKKLAADPSERKSIRFK